MTPKPTSPKIQAQNPGTTGNEGGQRQRKVWADGCYDMVHFGHANNLRQAKALGNGGRLVVGVHSDAEIQKHKSCPPVFTEDERYTMIGAIKWVDEVVEAAPYVTTLETMDKYGCDICAHGDDITTTADGADTYQAVKDGRRYENVARTHGVSTTDLLNRILAREKNANHYDDLRNNNCGKVSSPYTGKCQFLLTTKKLHQFSNLRDPPPGAKVVYVAGSFDIFHPGHLAFLKAAKERGNFLIVGVYPDNIVSDCKGPKYPIMNLNERVLSILACKYVDEIVYGAPYGVSAELLDHFNVSVVAHGEATPVLMDHHTGQDPYLEPTRRGIFTKITSGSDLTTEKIVERVLSNTKLYAERNAKKEQQEVDRLLNSNSED